jgi:hypothetical protein
MEEDLMNQFVTEAYIHNGHLELSNIPWQDNMKVSVIVIPTVDLSQMSFPDIWEVTSQMTPKLSQDVSAERDTR